MPALGALLLMVLFDVVCLRMQAYRVAYGDGGFSESAYSHYGTQNIFTRLLMAGMTAET